MSIFAFLLQLFYYRKFSTFSLLIMLPISGLFISLIRSKSWNWQYIKIRREKAEIFNGNQSSTKKFCRELISLSNDTKRSNIACSIKKLEQKYEKWQKLVNYLQYTNGIILKNCIHVFRYLSLWYYNKGPGKYSFK